VSTGWPSTTNVEGTARAPGRSYWLGRVGYLEAARLQHALVAERQAGRVPDLFLLLEHPPVITMGRGSHAENLLAAETTLAAAGATVWETTRGGDVTYHGPGQLVGYGILDLRERGRDVGRYLRDLEEALIRTLGDFGLVGERRPGMTGAWVGDRKLAAIGVRAERWVTAHGFALNVDPDLGHFDWIVPCGIRDYSVGSIGALLRERDPAARVPGLEEVAESARRQLQEVFGVELRPQDARDLSSLAPPDTAPLGGVRRLFPPDAS
jgi:lipoyl(octanoyl) transferase